MKNFAYAAFAAMCLLIGISAWHASSAFEVLSKDVPKEIALTRSELAATRADINAQLAGARVDIVRQLDLFRKDANAQASVAIATIDARTAEITQIINAQLAVANASLDNVTVSLDEVSTPTGALIAQINQQEPMIYSRYLATTGELNKTLDAWRITSNEVAKASPQLAQSAVQIADDASKVTGYVAGMTKKEAMWTSLLLALPRFLLKIF